MANIDVGIELKLLGESKVESGLKGVATAAEDASKDLDDLADELKDLNKAADSARFSGVSQGLTGLGDSADSVGSRLTSLGKGAVAGLGIAIAGLATTAATAGAALVKSATEAYAAYEQSRGGVEKLFGDAASSVIQNANAAFATAGIDANSYMEQVASFSAQLINSLSGDTEAAARIADMAMRDMSDNANVFGTSIDSIQQTYQSLARGNFAMLDNLKLGYGGTAAEMARLLNDSGVLEEGLVATAENINQIGFDKFIEAIHAIQEDLNIAGTTANEAATTISGSLGMLGATWQNLLVALAYGDGVTEATNQVIEALTNVVNNAAPIMGSVMESVSAMGPQLGSIFETIGGLVAQHLPGLLGAGVQMVNGLLQGIISALPMLATGMAPVFMSLLDVVLQNLPILLEAGLQIMAMLMQGLGAALPTLVPQIVTVLLAMVQIFIDNMPVIFAAGQQILQGLGEGLIAALPVIVAALPQIIDGITSFLLGAMPLMIETGIALLNALVDNMPAIVEAISAALPQIIDGLIKFFIAAAPLLGAAGFELLSALAQRLPSAASRLAGQMPQIIQGLLGGLRGGIGQLMSVGGDLMEGLWHGIQTGIRSLTVRAINLANSLVNSIRRVFRINSPSKLMADKVGQYLPSGIGEGLWDNRQAAIEPVKKLTGLITHEAKSQIDYTGSKPMFTPVYKPDVYWRQQPNNRNYTNSSNVNVNVHNPVAERTSDTIKKTAALLHI